MLHHRTSDLAQCRTWETRIHGKHLNTGRSCLPQIDRRKNSERIKKSRIQSAQNKQHTVARQWWWCWQGPYTQRTERDQLHGEPMRPDAHKNKHCRLNAETWAHCKFIKMSLEMGRKREWSRIRQRAQRVDSNIHSLQTDTETKHNEWHEN